MTKEEILVLEAGKKLDALIAEWKDGCYHDWKGQSVPHAGIVLRCTKCGAFRESGRQLPNQHYSTSISAAWQVVDKLVSEYYEFQLRTVYHHGKWHWYCSFEAPEDLGEGYFYFEANAAPVAICKAALLAKRGV